MKKASKNTEHLEKIQKIKEAYLKNPSDIINQEYYEYLKKETEFSIKECYDYLMEMLMEKKYK